MYRIVVVFEIAIELSSRVLYSNTQLTGTFLSADEVS